MPVAAFKGAEPAISASAFVAPDAWITGAVELGEQVSVLFGAVLRGDVERIVVGSGSNIQDHCILHTSTGLQDCLVGAGVTVGHRAILHGCSISDNCLIGMGATVLDGAEVGEGAIVGAQSLVPANMKIPAGMLALGVPARIRRGVTAEELEDIKRSAAHYVEIGREYRRVGLSGGPVQKYTARN